MGWLAVGCSVQSQSLKSVGVLLCFDLRCQFQFHGLGLCCCYGPFCCRHQDSAKVQPGFSCLMLHAACCILHAACAMCCPLSAAIVIAVVILYLVIVKLSWRFCYLRKLGSPGQFDAECGWLWLKGNWDDRWWGCARCRCGAHMSCAIYTICRICISINTFWTLIQLTRVDQ